VPGKLGYRRREVSLHFRDYRVYQDLQRDWEELSWATRGSTASSLVASTANRLHVLHGSGSA